jgi:hypothetical protein
MVFNFIGVVETLAELIQSDDLKIGSIFQTLGKEVINDKQASMYLVVDNKDNLRKSTGNCIKLNKYKDRCLLEIAEVAESRSKEFTEEKFSALNGVIRSTLNKVSTSDKGDDGK